MAALWFLGDFYLRAPERLAALDRQDADLVIMEVETKNIGRAYDTVLEAWSAAADVARFYNAHMVGRLVADPLPPQLLAEGLNKVNLARRRIATATGNLAGLQFTDTELASLAKGIQEDLGAADQTMAVLEQSLEAGAKGDTELSIRLLAAADHDRLNAEREGAATLSRARSWSERANALMQRALADAQALEAQRRHFALRMYGTIPALVYVLGFVAIGIRAWRKATSKGRRSKRRAAGA